jgi:filamentous hemagglutinin
MSLQAEQSVNNLGASALMGASDPLGTLEILAAQIVNRDDQTATDTQAGTTILGLGRVVLGGRRDAQGQLVAAQEIRNQSGLIQSGGDMQIRAVTVSNTRRQIQTSDTYESTGQTVKGTVVWSLDNPDVPGGRYIEPDHGGLWHSGYLHTDYTGDIQQNQLLKTSPRSVIQAGGNLDLSGSSSLQNYWSSIVAGGNLSQTSLRGINPSILSR